MQRFDCKAIAQKYDNMPEDELGIELISHDLDGVEYENVLLFNKKNTAAVAGVISVPNYFGISQIALEIAASTIGAAQAILVADVFGKTVRPKTPDEALAAIKPLKADRNELRRRMQAVCDVWLHRNKNQMSQVKWNGKLGACGFCFGGTAVLELARSGAALNAVVSLHGALDTPNPQDAQQIKAAVLILHGMRDPSVPRAQVDAFIDAMSATKLDWHLVQYSEAGHSFTDPSFTDPDAHNVSSGFFYHERTAKRASIALRHFFAEHLA